MTRTMWGIQDPTQGQLLQTIGLSDNPNLYSSRLEAETQAKRNGAEVIEVELVEIVETRQHSALEYFSRRALAAWDRKTSAILGK